MDFYLITLNAIKKIFTDAEYNAEAEIIEECIQKWQSSKDTAAFLKEISKGGRFEDFTLDIHQFDSLEQTFWTAQLLTALIAMAMQIARFYQNNKEITLKFIREHFGRTTEVITGSFCPKCEYREINLYDIDKYISGSIISNLVIHGLEEGDLTASVESVMNLTNPRIERERQRTQTRIENSKIPYSMNYGRSKKCLLCGGTDIRDARFLKSLKANVFIPLGIKK